MTSSADDRMYDNVRCTIAAWVFIYMTYDLQVTGTNPVVSATTNITTHLNGAIGIYECI